MKISRSRRRACCIAKRREHRKGCTCNKSRNSHSAEQFPCIRFFPRVTRNNFNIVVQIMFIPEYRASLHLNCYVISWWVFNKKAFTDCVCNCFISSKLRFIEVPSPHSTHSPCLASGTVMPSLSLRFILCALENDRR